MRTENTKITFLCLSIDYLENKVGGFPHLLLSENSLLDIPNSDIGPIKLDRIILGVVPKLVVDTRHQA